MAAKRWLGVAPRVAQVSTITIGGTITIGDVFTIVCGYANVTVVAATSVAASVAAQIQAALAATTAPPEFYDAVWTVVSNVVTGTSRVAGVPFVVTSSATGTSTAVTAHTDSSEWAESRWDSRELLGRYVASIGRYANHRSE